MDTKHHEEQCRICKSEHRKEIEEKYLEWQSPESLSSDYPEFAACSIRNHCKTFGLDVTRNKDLRGVCVAVMERGFTCMKHSPVDSRSVIAAANLKAKLDGLIVDKTEHSGKVTAEIDIKSEVKKQVDNLVGAIGGVPDALPE
jgi:hypothetical protein